MESRSRPLVAAWSSWGNRRAVAARSSTTRPRLSLAIGTARLDDVRLAAAATLGLALGYGALEPYLDL